MMPFMYMTETGMYVVYLASYGYQDYDSRWMGDSPLGDHCYVPDLDIVKDGSMDIFDNERAALKYMQKLWATLEL